MKKGKLLITLSVFTALLLSSCATTLSYSVDRPAKLNLNGANTVSVLPFAADKENDDLYFFQVFKKKDRQDDKQRFADHVTTTMVSQLKNEQFLEVVESSQVESAMSAGSKIPCDVYLTGFISDWKDDVKKNSKGNKYYREAEARVNYQIIDSKTNIVISSGYKDVKEKTGEYSMKMFIPDATSTLMKQTGNIVENILTELQPYTENKSAELLKDDSKDPNFTKANDNAKNGLYKESQDLFLELYKNGNIKAGYNAAILMQIQGNLDEAQTLMKEVSQKIDEKNYKKCIKALEDIQNDIDSSKKLQKQLSGKSKK